ncbi:S49 family peptidase [Thauera aromatica]|uniref:S49 family peptidase n=1 Tax=Thauera aromatica TaxID=59405 RepID=UPI002494B647|nr:S49 family peptidase [Thauera aromatica]
MKYPHLAARVFNTPLLIHPQKLDAIIAGLGGRLLDTDLSGVAHAVQASALPAELFSTRRVEDKDRRPGYAIIDGVAVIYASGVLAHRGRFVMASSDRILGYNDLAAALEMAQADTDVHAVLQVFDTPGGEAQGAFEYHDRLREMRGNKPVWGIADGLAASAGYLAAAGLEHFAITRTGYAGSIGVVMRHVDLSQALAQEGIRVTHIYAGDHKVDGNQFEPLPDSVCADLQAEINDLHQMFISAVASGRGLDPEAVRKTQAQTYRGQAALDAGLADRIATTDQLIAELAGLRARPHPVGQSARITAQQGDSLMSETPQAGTTTQPATPPAVQAASPSPSQADLDRARAEGVEQGTQAERARVGAVLAHPSASCSPLALQCISTGLTTEQATAVLGAVPAGAPVASAPNNAFAAAMAAIPNPGVSGIEAAAAPENTEAALAASIVGLIGSARQ